MKFDAKAFLAGLFVEAAEPDVAPDIEGATGAALRTVPRTPDELPADWRVEFEERAAIREYDGGQAREHAEAEAFQEITTRMRAAGEIS